MTSRDQLAAIHADTLKNYKTGITKPYEFRCQQLEALKRFLTNEQNILAEALHKDLHRGTFEALGLEIMATVIEIDHILKHLKEWMEPQQTSVPALFAPAISEIHCEPFGLCLIIGAFNYPVVLTLGPLIGAIAAGNAAIIKPSEMSPASEKVLNELLPKYLDQRVYRVAIGDYKVNQALLSLRWDKIFFTGSTRVGKIVLQAAAENLTPVSLELGGKSPTIVDESVTDLELVAQRIVWGKNVNAGQTCIAPDYVYCHEKHFDAFLALLKRKSEEFYGKDAQKSPDFGRIVSAGHFQRLKAMLDDSKDKVHCGGRVDENDRFIEPTVLVSPSPTSKIMTEEIFGPLLPVFKFRRLEEVIDVINEGEKPLTMYIFARDRAPVEKLIAAVSSGSVVVNDCLFQFANVYAPFGGVGFSGMGNYRGRYSFECFSTKRSVLRRDDHRILDVPVRYPPYTDFGLKFFKFAAYNLPDVPAFDRRLLIKAVVVLGVIVAFILK